VDTGPSAGIGAGSLRYNCFSACCVGIVSGL